MIVALPPIVDMSKTRKEINHIIASFRCPDTEIWRHISATVRIQKRQTRPAIPEEAPKQDGGGVRKRGSRYAQIVLRPENLETHNHLT